MTRSCSATSCFQTTHCESVCGVSVLSGAVHHVVLCSGALRLHVGVWIFHVSVCCIRSLSQSSQSTSLNRRSDPPPAGQLYNETLTLFWAEKHSSATTTAAAACEILLVVGVQEGLNDDGQLVLHDVEVARHRWDWKRVWKRFSALNKPNSVLSACSHCCSYLQSSAWW